MLQWFINLKTSTKLLAYYATFVVLFCAVVWQGLASARSAKASQAAELIHEAHEFQAEEILVNADYLGGGYGIMGDPEKKAIRLFAQKEGLLLDPVYTGRAAAGMIDLISKGFFKTEETVLFWHTGGTPALFAGQYAPDLSTVNR